MKAIFWGSRGSVPASLQFKDIHKKVREALEIALKYRLTSEEDIEAFIKRRLPFTVRGCYGSNTSCVELKGGNEFLLLDAGTGLRDFGNAVMKSSLGGEHFHILMSHFHWDHIQGFPFFIPAYGRGNRVDIYSMHKDLKRAFITQQSPPFFPVSLQDMEATIHFHHLEPDHRYSIAGFQVTGTQQDHPGVSFGYCLEQGNKKIIYSTDCEHTAGTQDAAYPFLEFIRNADLLIFDTQYSFLESVQAKRNWGHSSNMMAVDLAVKAGVKHLCMFHTEPTQDDISLARTEELTRKYVSTYAKSSSLTISLAYDGLEIEV